MPLHAHPHLPPRPYRQDCWLIRAEADYQADASIGGKWCNGSQSIFGLSRWFLSRGFATRSHFDPPVSRHFWALAKPFGALAR